MSEDRDKKCSMFETTNYRVFVIENVGRPGQKVIDVRNDKLQDVRYERILMFVMILFISIILH
jgi:hypothetical protein